MSFRSTSVNLVVLIPLVVSAASCGDDEVSTPPVDVEYQPHVVLDLGVEDDVADPHVIKVGDTWYLYATNSQRSDGFRVWVSQDLQSWQDAGLVWTPTDDSWYDLGEYWAPHVEPTDDGYYMYYTASYQIGLAWSESPLGPFEDVFDHPFVGGGYGGVGEGTFPNGVPQDFDEYAIDAFVLAPRAGGLVFYYVAYDPVSKIYAVPMVDYETLSDEEPVVVLEPQLTSWEGFIVEGPWITEHEGAFHLMYSGNFANTVNYGLGVAVSTDPMGPFERYPNNPLLEVDLEAGFYGPGHNSVVEGAYDDLLLFYHTKVDVVQEWLRRIRYVPISFDAQGLIRLDVPAP